MHGTGDVGKQQKGYDPPERWTTISRERYTKIYYLRVVTAALAATYRHST